MNPVDRQYALKRRGITQHKIAQDLGVTDVSVSDVIIGRRISDRIMRGVAAAISEDVRLVFPEYYLRPPKRKTSKVSQAACSGVLLFPSANF
jgi:transcriptional regulator with XRE-family HTH domain